MRRRCDRTVFYVDLGWSSGMRAAKAYCEEHKLPFEERRLNVNALAQAAPFCSAQFCATIISGDDYKPLLQ